MTAVLVALGAIVWLFFSLLGIALAAAAARGDRLLPRAVPAQRERHAPRAA
jgi:hypothetical protein